MRASLSPPACTEIGPGPGDATALPWPDGSFDSVGCFTMLHHFHENDVYNPIEPGTLFTRLETIGYDRITVSVQWGIHFRARKPPLEPDEWRP
jgi:Methyltransferase domain